MFKNKEEQFDFYWKEIFTGLAYNPIEFNTYRFDQTMSLPGKVNKLYEMFKQLALNNQEVMDYLKEFVETFDFKLETTIKDILLIWLENGLLAEYIREIINEEVVEARDGHDTLKERLDSDTNETLEKLNERYTKEEIQIGFALDKKDINNYQPRQLEDISELYATNRTKLLTKLESLKQEGFKMLGVITDTHYHPDSVHFGGIQNGTNIALGNIKNFLSFSDYFISSILGGDNVDSTSIDKVYPYGLNQGFAMNAFTQTENPLFMFKGNHDDGSFFVEGNINSPNSSLVLGEKYHKYCVTNREFSYLYKWNERLYNEKRNNSSGYFFYDIGNIRIIGLDSYDNPEKETLESVTDVNAIHSQFSLTQLKWLAENAFNNVGNKHVIIYTHCPLDNTVQPTSTTYTTNHNLMLDLIEKFVHGGVVSIGGVSYTFNGNPNLIGVVSGHLHKNVNVVKNNINYIGLTCDLYARNPTDTNYYGTPKQTEFAVIGIHTEQKKIKVVHFSRDEDYETFY